MALYTRLNGDVPQKNCFSIVNDETGEVVANISTTDPRVVLALDLACGYHMEKPNGHISKGVCKCQKNKP